MPKHALIVDDSPSARLILGRMLTRHKLEVEAVASAEEALDYLKHARPDVIFMDHQMPGMDGLQALSAIKSNPDTATIPVMMYTSQSGEVYVGQARALGALGVLPKQVQPVEVSEVLRSLHLIDDELADAAAAVEAAAELSSPSPAAANAIRDLLTDLFAQQRELLRAELRGIAGPESSESSSPVVPWQWATALLAVALLVTLVMLQRSAGDPPGVPAEAPGAASAPVATPMPSAVEPDAMRGATSVEALQSDWLPALEWALNQDLRPGPGTPLLGDDAAALLRELLELLDSLEYRGTVWVQTHVGRFCLQRDGFGDLQPAAPQLPLAQCEVLGLSETDARREGLRQSLAFANAMGALATRFGERIRIELVTAGSSEPQLAYPPLADELPAGVWNSIAASNHRLEIRMQAAQRTP
ncbi:MAG: response regulator [Gammaproteobacteria bacterium]|nr:response regulator [Gammaproteobacteria bacterium]